MSPALFVRNCSDGNNPKVHLGWSSRGTIPQLDTNPAWDIVTMIKRSSMHYVSGSLAEPYHVGVGKNKSSSYFLPFGPYRNHQRIDFFENREASAAFLPTRIPIEPILGPCWFLLTWLDTVWCPSQNQHRGTSP